MSNMEVDGSSSETEENQPASTVKITTEITDCKERAEAYKNLKERIETLQECEDAGLTAAKELNDIFSTLELLTRRETTGNPKHEVHMPEYVSDVTILKTGSEILIKCIDNVDNDAAPYEPTDYANNLLNYTEESEDIFGERSILMLINVARNAIQSVPEYNSLYGSLDPAVEFLPKVQKQRQQCKPGQKQQLKQVKLADSVEDSIEYRLVSMYTVLKEEFAKNNQKPINYLRFLVDSESFGNTVSNMFYFSFLIKDGRAGINIVNEVAYIWPLKKGIVKKFYEDGGENSQFISSIDMQTWKEYRKAGPGYIQIKKQSQL